MAHVPLSSDPSRLFAEHVAANPSDPSEGFEELCAAHPAHEGELRTLLSGWSVLQQKLRLDPAVARALLSDRPMSTIGRTTLGTEMIEKLAARPMLHDRYTSHGEIARGGMGVIFRVHDEDLDRPLAMKVISTDAGVLPSDLDSAGARSLSRFLEEAQITAQLDHPGIVPVHQIGMDDEGRVFFTMKLVRGRDLADVFRLCAEGLEGWTQTRLLSTLSRACEALAYAHAKGVIHRDLKPANIMVGPFGEVYVMDWGLARVLSNEPRPESTPGAVANDPYPASVKVQSARRQLEHEAPDSPLNTMQGDVVGTPAYMSPEQAEGRLHEMGPQSDVYSMGAMLYHLLAGHMPYGEPGADLDAWTILKSVRRGPPSPLSEAAPTAPAELIAIANKAMARAPAERYVDMSALAADVSAYLEGRVVGAYESGTFAELRKWIARNKGLTATFLGGVAALVLGLVVSLYLGDEARRQRKNVLSLSAFSVLDELAARADSLWPVDLQLEADYEAWLVDARRLIDGLDQLEGEDGHRASLAKLRKSAARLPDDDLTRARREHPRYAELAALEGELTARRNALDVRLGTGLVESAPVPPEFESSPSAVLNEHAWQRVRPQRERFGLEAEGLAMARRALERATSEDRVSAIEDTLAWACFANGLDEEALEHARAARDAAGRADVATFDAGLERLEDAIAGASEPASVARIQRLELEVARVRDQVDSELAWRFEDDDRRWWHAQLTRLVLDIERFADPETGLVQGISPEHGWGVARRLDAARRIAEISVTSAAAQRAWTDAEAAIVSLETYHGFRLPPQPGLLPLGVDPQSGLWEFAHVASGELPERDENDRVVMGSETCVVLVLLPGGSFSLGAQADDPKGLNYDAAAERDEQPIGSVTLAPFLLSKFELTQSQWERFTDARPSQFFIGSRSQGKTVTGAHPVENVSWLDCERTLTWFGLTLPTEAQWEYAARATTEWPWYTGNERESLRGAENLADRTAALAGYEWPAILDWPDLDDGHAIHAPVGRFRANRFGLFDVLGNVREWCLDAYQGDAYVFPTRPITGERIIFGPRTRVSRGGNHVESAENSRVSYRIPYLPEFSYHYLGVRPACTVRLSER